MSVARIINPLERKYLEVEEELNSLKQHGSGQSEEGLRLAHALECLRVTIHLFDAGWRPRKPKQPRDELNEFGQRRGELGGAAIRIIGDAENPMTTREIAEEVAKRLELALTHAQFDRLANVHLSAFLRRLERNGYLKEEGSPIRWSLTEATPVEWDTPEPVKPRPRTPKHLRRRKT